MANEVSVVELRKGTADIINRATYKSERTVITKHSKPVAAVVPIEDAELLEALEDAVDIQLAREALAEKKRIDWSDLKAR